MNSESKKFFEPRPNYSALAEFEEKHSSKTTEEDVRSFLNFWQEVYYLWLEKNSPFDPEYVDEKIRVRKLLIEKFGTRT